MTELRAYPQIEKYDKILPKVGDKDEREKEL